MKLIPLSSGSSGNSIFIEENNTRILIDAGHSGKKIESLLKDIDVDPSTIDAIFVTHEHIDHVKGVGVLHRRYKMDVFASEVTFRAMESQVKKIDGEKIKIFQNSIGFRYKDLYIEPMEIYHDCQEGNSFVIHSKDEKATILTDTGWVNTEMMKKMDGSDIYYLEANHNVEMLVNGTYPWQTKQRILSNRGHLSNENAGEILNKLLRKKGERIILAHLSSDNNSPSIALKEVNTKLRESGKIEGVDYTIKVAKRDAVTRDEVENE